MSIKSNVVSINNPRVLDFADPDDFFRRGDEYSSTSNSLEPPMGRDIALSDASDELDPASVRTPEQEARRHRFAQRVFVGMSVLALGTAAALVGQLRTSPSDADSAAARRPQEPEVALIQTPKVTPEPATLAVKPAPEPKLAAANLDAPRTPAPVTAHTVAPPPVAPTEPVVSAARRITEAAVLPEAQTNRRAANTNTSAKAKTAASASLVTAKSTASKPPKAAAVNVRKALSSAAASTRPSNYRPPTASFAD